VLNLLVGTSLLGDWFNSTSSFVFVSIISKEGETVLLLLEALFWVCQSKLGNLESELESTATEIKSFDNLIDSDWLLLQFSFSSVIVTDTSRPNFMASANKF
jgi:hypothetical protein